MSSNRIDGGACSREPLVDAIATLLARAPWRATASLLPPEHRGAYGDAVETDCGSV
jgi:hypothetical protein